MGPRGEQGPAGTMGPPGPQGPNGISLPGEPVSYTHNSDVYSDVLFEWITVIAPELKCASFLKTYQGRPGPKGDPGDPGQAGLRVSVSFLFRFGFLVFIILLEKKLFI